jgi:hypothetical protein
MKLFDRIKCALNKSSWDEMMRQWLSGGDISPSGDISVAGQSAYKFTAVFACHLHPYQSPSIAKTKTIPVKKLMQQACTMFFITLQMRK